MHEMENDNMTKKPMPPQVQAALTVLLQEFGENDLHPRLKHFLGGDDEDAARGRELAKAWVLVETWLRGNEDDVAPENIKAQVDDLIEFYIADLERV